MMMMRGGGGGTPRRGSLMRGDSEYKESFEMQVEQTYDPLERALEHESIGRLLMKKKSSSRMLWGKTKERATTRDKVKIVLGEHLEALRGAGLAFDVTFRESKLNLSVALAQYGKSGREFVEVESVKEASEAFSRLKPSDELVAVNDVPLLEPSRDNFGELLRRISSASRPLKLTFVLGARRDDAKAVTTPKKKKTTTTTTKRKKNQQQQQQQQEVAELVRKSRSAEEKASAAWDRAEVAAARGKADESESLAREALRLSQTCEACLEEARKLGGREAEAVLAKNAESAKERAALAARAARSARDKALREEPESLADSAGELAQTADEAADALVEHFVKRVEGLASDLDQEATAAELKNAVAESDRNRVDAQAKAQDAAHRRTASGEKEAARTAALAAKSAARARDLAIRAELALDDVKKAHELLCAAAEAANFAVQQETAADARRAADDAALADAEACRWLQMRLSVVSPPLCDAKDDASGSGLLSRLCAPSRPDENEHRVRKTARVVRQEAIRARDAALRAEGEEGGTSLQEEELEEEEDEEEEDEEEEDEEEEEEEGRAAVIKDLLAKADAAAERAEIAAHASAEDAEASSSAAEEARGRADDVKLAARGLDDEENNKVLGDDAEMAASGAEDYASQAATLAENAEAAADAAREAANGVENGDENGDENGGAAALCAKAEASARRAETIAGEVAQRRETAERFATQVMDAIEAALEAVQHQQDAADEAAVRDQIDEFEQFVREEDSIFRTSGDVAGEAKDLAARASDALHRALDARDQARAEEAAEDADDCARRAEALAATPDAPPIVGECAKSARDDAKAARVAVTPPPPPPPSESTPTCAFCFPDGDVDLPVELSEEAAALVGPGVLVRLRPFVDAPDHGWQGLDDRTKIGVVVRLQSNTAIVAFSGLDDRPFKARCAELEVVHDDIEGELLVDTVKRAHHASILKSRDDRLKLPGYGYHHRHVEPSIDPTAEPPPASNGTDYANAVFKPFAAPPDEQSYDDIIDDAPLDRG